MIDLSVEKLLKELVAMRTISADTDANQKALDYVEAFLGECGMRVHRAAYDGYGTLVATTRPTRSPRVMLVGHIDVVAAPDEMFTITEKDGRLYGRGTRDMKGAIAAYMTVAKELGSNIADYDFGIMLISDEETHDMGIVRLLDGGESWGLEKMAKGALYLKVEIAGKSAHGSRPWLGDSASFKLVEFLAELKKDFAGHGPETDTLNISNISAGTGAFNQLPASASAQLDIRIINPTHGETLRQRIRELCAKYDGKMEELVFFPVLEHDLSNPYISGFADSIAKVTGERHEAVIAYGASDASRFDELGIPCAVTYPLSGGHHSDDEWIDRGAPRQLVAILRDYIEKMAS